MPSTLVFPLFFTSWWLPKTPLGFELRLSRAGTRDRPVDLTPNQQPVSNTKTVTTQAGQNISVTLQAPDKKARAVEKKQKLVAAFRGFALPSDFHSWVLSCKIEAQLAQAQLAEMAVDAASIPKLSAPYLSCVRVGFSSLAAKIPQYLQSYAPKLVPLEAFLTRVVQDTIGLLDALEVSTKDTFFLPDFCRAHNEHRRRSPRARDVFDRWFAFLSRLSEWSVAANAASPPKAPDYASILIRWSSASETITYMKEPQSMRQLRLKYEAAQAKKSGGGQNKKQPQSNSGGGGRPRRKKGGPQKTKSGGGGGKKKGGRGGRGPNKNKGQGQSSD